MKVLFIGGSGNISSACTYEAQEKNHEVFHFNRGFSSHYSFKQVTTLQGDINNFSDREQLKKHAPYDVVANFICFTPEQIQCDIDFFTDLTNQYIFISSATVYKKPPDHYIVTENTPLENIYWQYARDKIACEKILSAQGKLNYTIVRPSYTYGKTWIPLALTAHDYNPVYRIRKGLPIISHGDGESIWVTTHHSDFARAFVQLFGHSKAINNHFHLTSDEVHTWDQFHRIIGKIVGKEPNIIHIPSDFINQHEPEWGAGLLGDKARSAIFDNSKIKDLAEGWSARVSFEEGIRESIAWYEAKPERMIPNPEIEQRTDSLIKKFVKA